MDIFARFVLNLVMTVKNGIMRIKELSAKGITKDGKR